MLFNRNHVLLHHADSKHPKMFMRVIGYTRGGQIKTQYIDRSHKRTIYKNDPANLKSVEDYGFHGDEDAQEYERVRLWNFYHKIGTPVIIKWRGESVHTVTRSDAWLMGRKYAVVLVEGQVGGFYISEIEVDKEPAKNPLRTCKNRK